MVMKYLDVMKAAARECGRILLDRAAMEMNPNKKTSNRDIVTQFDVAVQSVLVERLSQAFPEARFVLEEGSAANSVEGGLVFVIDPIDGTMNFVKGFSHSCISIGCFAHGKPAAGVVYDPYKNELFSAAKGKGAFLNDVPICVTEDTLADTLVLFGTSPYNMETADQTWEAIRMIYNKCLDIRRMGSAALDLCYVACGRAGLYFEARVSLWDYAAGVLILTEAGGTARKLDGLPLEFSTERTSILAGSNKNIIKSGLAAEVCL